MLPGRLRGRVAKAIDFFRTLGRRLPSFPSSQEIDREYIEGETAEEIGEIGEMTNIPDKSDRHPKRSQRNTKVAGSTSRVKL